MICGAQKSGTSSLLQYLNAHSKIIKQNLNELPYIIDESIFNLGFENTFIKYFDAPSKEESIVVAKNVGVMHSPHAIKRLFDHNPDCIVVLLLRNPIDRAYSNYYYALRKGDETIDSFESAIDIEPKRLQENEFKWRHCAYLDRGIYHKQVEELLKYFPKDQLMIFTFENFKKDPQTILDEIFKKLNISPEPTIMIGKKYNEKAAVKSKFLARFLRNQGGIKKMIRNIFGEKLRKKLKSKVVKMNETAFDQPTMKIETRLKLIEYFRPLNKKFSDIANMNVDYWNK